MQDKPTHYRPKYTGARIACSPRIVVRDNNWTHDPDDVTCNSCQRTRVFKRANAERLNVSVTEAGIVTEETA